MPDHLVVRASPTSGGVPRKAETTALWVFSISLYKDNQRRSAAVAASRVPPPPECWSPSLCLFLQFAVPFYALYPLARYPPFLIYVVFAPLIVCFALLLRPLLALPQVAIRAGQSRRVGRRLTELLPRFSEICVTASQTASSTASSKMQQQRVRIRLQAYDAKALR